MKGICQSCGKMKEIKGCSICGARVCADCLLPGGGCKICHGRKEF